MRNRFLCVDLSAVNRVWRSVQYLLNCSLLLEYHKRKAPADNKTLQPVQTLLFTITLQTGSQLQSSNLCCTMHKFHPPHSHFSFMLNNRQIDSILDCSPKISILSNKCPLPTPSSFLLHCWRRAAVNERERVHTLVIQPLELVMSYLDFPVSRSNLRFTSSTGPYLTK